MVITRTDYLNQPEKWYGTKEEKELVEYCVDYIKNKKNFHFNFSPVTIEVPKIITHTNNEAKKLDVYFIILSKRTIEVYYERIEKDN